MILKYYRINRVVFRKPNGHNPSGRQISGKGYMVYEDLLCWGVGVENVEKVVRTVGKCWWDAVW